MGIRYTIVRKHICIGALRKGHCSFPTRGGTVFTYQKASGSISEAGEAWHRVCYGCGPLTDALPCLPRLTTTVIDPGGFW